MLPLDPGWAADSTVGGVVAANLSGPRRRLYGTARDMVIGMTFATLEGKLVSSGGMVVKNVAGLDMAKLMIGSFGTLAAIAQVNFKVFPVPAESRTFVMEFSTRGRGLRRARPHPARRPPARRDRHRQYWPVAAISVLLSAVARGGNAKVLERYARELPAAQPCSESVWDEIREFTPRFLAANPARTRCSDSRRS